MANTRQVKVMVPQGQIEIIQQWVDKGLFASITAFCTSAVEKQIDRQIELNAEYEAERAGGVTPATPDLKTESGRA